VYVVGSYDSFKLETRTLLDENLGVVFVRIVAHVHMVCAYTTYASLKFGMRATYDRNLGVMSVGVVLFAFVSVPVIDSYVRHDSLICDISRIHTCETWRILCMYM